MTKEKIRNLRRAAEPHRRSSTSDDRAITEMLRTSYAAHRQRIPPELKRSVPGPVRSKLWRQAMTQALRAYKKNLMQYAADHPRRPRSGGIVLIVCAALLLAIPPARAQSRLDHFSGSGTITTSAGSAVVWSPGAASACFVGISGTWTGTATFKGSPDGATYYQIEGVGQVFRAWYPSTTSNGDWELFVAGMKTVEVVGPVSTGSATVSYSCGPGPAWMYGFATPASIEGVWFNGTDATATQTAGPLFIQGQKQLDWFFLPAALTGSPSGCKLQFKGSADGVTYYSNTAGAPSITTSGYQSGSITTMPMGIALEVTWSCTVYPSGGLLYLETTAK